MSEAIGIVERLNDLRLAAFRAGGFDTPAAKAYYCALSTAFQRDELVDAAEIARLTARIAELENGFSMDSAPLDGTAILLQSETGSLNIGWRSGDVWSYGGGKWEDRLVVRWWPLPRTFREARTTLEASERGGGE